MASVFIYIKKKDAIFVQFFSAKKRPNNVCMILPGTGVRMISVFLYFHRNLKRKGKIDSKWRNSYKKNTEFRSHGCLSKLGDGKLWIFNTIRGLIMNWNKEL